MPSWLSNIGESWREHADYEVEGKISPHCRYQFWGISTPARVSEPPVLLARVRRLECPRPRPDTKVRLRGVYMKSAYPFKTLYVGWIPKLSVYMGQV